MKLQPQALVNARVFAPVLLFTSLSLTACGFHANEAATGTPATASAPVRTDAPLPPQNAAHASTQAEIRRGGFMEALSCEPSSGLPRALSLARYELVRFDQATWMTSPDAKDWSTALALVTDRLKKERPFTAHDLRDFWPRVPVTSMKVEDRSESTLPLPGDDIPDSVDKNPLPEPVNPVLVPRGCTLVPVLALDASPTGYVLNGDLWARLEPLDQAAILIQLRAAEWTVLFGKKDFIAARKYVRMLMTQKAPDYQLIRTVTSALGDETIHEAGYDNGDSAFARVRFFTQNYQSNYTRPMALKACHYQLAGDTTAPTTFEQVAQRCEVSIVPGTNKYSKSNKFAVYSYGPKRIGRVESLEDKTAVYLGPLADNGFGNDVIDVMTKSWQRFTANGVDAAAPYSYTSDGDYVSITYSADHTFGSQNFTVVCPSGQPAMFWTPRKHTLAWDISPDNLSFVACGLSANSKATSPPLKVNLSTAGKNVSVEARYEERNGMFTTHNLVVTKPFSLPVGSEQIPIAVDSLFYYASNDYVSLNLPGKPIVTANVASVNCPVLAQSIVIYKNDAKGESKPMMVRGTFKPGCKIARDGAAIEPIGEISFEAGEKIKAFGIVGDHPWGGVYEKPVSKMSILGQSFQMAAIYFDDQDKIICFNSQDPSIRYLEGRDGKMHSGASYGASSFVVNRDHKRLDSVFDCPLKGKKR